MWWCWTSPGVGRSIPRRSSRRVATHRLRAGPSRAGRAHDRRRQRGPPGGGSRRVVTASAVARRMAQCCRQLAAHGLIAGQDGNLSVRLGPDIVLVTPTGVIKALLEPADMVEVDLRG